MSSEQHIRRLSAASLAAGDPTGWFEQLYAQAQNGDAEVPWDRPAPSPNLVSAGLGPGHGRPALVVGCGLGRDAEYLAGLGYATTAFDISATAVRVARQRHPGSPVDYQVADLLAPPPPWLGAFDLVLESNNVQALPRDLRRRAIPAVGALVAPGGTLLVLAAAAADPRRDRRVLRRRPAAGVGGADPRSGRPTAAALAGRLPPLEPGPPARRLRAGVSGAPLGPRSPARR